MPRQAIRINRAPVLTLWAAVVAERLGYDEETALTLGKAVAGLNAQSKGRRLGIFEAPERERPEKRAAEAGRRKGRFVPLLGRGVPVVETARGIRAVAGEGEVDPAGVARYLAQKFGDTLDDVREAMRELAAAYPRGRLADIAFSLYEKFRPRIPDGKAGWGAKGTLDTESIRSLAPPRRKM
jgi:hypothetical protein